MYGFDDCILHDGGDVDGGLEASAHTRVGRVQQLQLHLKLRAAVGSLVQSCSRQQHCALAGGEGTSTTSEGSNTHSLRLTFLTELLSTPATVMVAAWPALICRQAARLILNRMDLTVVLLNPPPAIGPISSFSPSLTTPLLRIPPSTSPTPSTLNSSSTWNSAGCWLSSSCLRCVVSTGTWWRKRCSSGRLCPVTHEMWNMGATLGGRMTGNFKTMRVLLKFPLTFPP